LWILDSSLVVDLDGYSRDEYLEISPLIYGLDSYKARATRQAPDRSWKSDAREPSDRTAVDRPIVNHGQSRHFPPFHNNLTCFDVTKNCLQQKLCSSRDRGGALPAAPPARGEEEET
jgi:hypothetical protein